MIHPTVSRYLKNLSDEEETEYWDLRMIISNLADEGLPNVEADIPKDVKWAYDRINDLKDKNRELESARQNKIIKELCELQKDMMSASDEFVNERLDRLVNAYREVSKC